MCVYVCVCVCVFQDDSSVSDVSQVLQMGSALQAQVGRLVSAMIKITEKERQQAMERGAGRMYAEDREDLNQTESNPPLLWLPAG